MSKAIPLRTTLGIQCVQVIISYAFHQRFDLMLELLAIESRELWNMQRKTVVPSGLTNSGILFAEEQRTLMKSSVQS